MATREDGLIPDIFDDLEIGITVHDPETAAILDVNSRLEDLYGYSAAELREMRVEDYSVGTTEYSQAEAERRITAAAAGDPQTFEWHVQPASGAPIWVRVRLSRATLDGRNCVVAEIRDITGKKERERELERQNERLDQFASMVSHDLRNPLQVAQERLAAAREDTDSPHFENIARAHDRMEDIIAETLTLARQGETVDDLEALDLNETIERWWTDSDTDGATLETERLPTVLCDAGRLRHVFENLFRNAVEHGSTSNRTASDDAVEHGSPTPQANGDGPATPTVRVGSLPDGVYVEDDGPGIPPEDRDRVTDAGHTTADDNTGFGLTIVEQIVDAHGWELTITDGEDGGARFEITGVRTV